MRARLAASLSLTVLLASCGAAPPPEPPSGPSGTTNTPTTAGAPQDLTFYGLDTVDASTAFVFGLQPKTSGGAILKTTDGGAHWIGILRVADVDLTGIDFVDAQRGVAVTSGGCVLTTEDGGRTWAASADPRQFSAKLPSAAVDALEINDVTFSGSAVGCAVGSRRVAASTPAKTDDEDDGAQAIPAAYWTKDGGATWTASKLDSKLPPVSLAKAVFANSTLGWAIGGDTDDLESELMLVTTDGGASWKRIPLKVGQSPTDTCFVSATRGWLVGRTEDDATGDPGPSAIYATEDGGKTWTSQKSLSVSLYAVGFADQNHGWAVGDSSKIVRTEDGGATWVEQTTQDAASGPLTAAPEPPAAAGLAALVFGGIVLIEPGHGWAPSDKGIYEYRRP